MWQLYATFRVGEYRSRELNITPLIAASLLLLVFFLLLGGSQWQVGG